MIMSKAMIFWHIHDTRNRTSYIACNPLSARSTIFQQVQRVEWRLSRTAMMRPTTATKKPAVVNASPIASAWTVQ